MVSVGWLQALNQAYPGAAQYLQNAGAARPRLTRQPNPGWGLALAAVGVAGAGYAAWRSHQMWDACAPSTDLIPDGWLTESGKLNPIAQQAVAQLFPVLYEMEGIKGARELAWAAVRKLAGSDECPEDPPRLLVGRMRTVMSTATDMASEFVSAMERVANPMKANKERFKNGACFPGVEAAIGLDPGVYGTRQYNPQAQENPMMPIFRGMNNYRSHPDYQRSSGWVRRRSANQAGTIGPALGLSPFVYGQPGPWAPPLALQPHFPANNPGPDARAAVSRLGNPTYSECKRTNPQGFFSSAQVSGTPSIQSVSAHTGRAFGVRNPNPPTAIDFRPSQDSPWIPSPGYGTGEYGRQYAPNRTPFPGLPQNAPWVPPNMLVGPTDTIVVGARKAAQARVRRAAAQPGSPRVKQNYSPCGIYKHGSEWKSTCGGLTANPCGTGKHLCGSSSPGDPPICCSNSDGSQVAPNIGWRARTPHQLVRQLPRPRRPTTTSVRVAPERIPWPNPDDVSVGSKSARLARNMWGAMANCSGGNKTCGKALDFRDPSSMMSHAQGGRQPNPQPPYPQQAPFVPYYPAQMPVAVAGRGGGTRLFNSRWNTAFGGCG